MEPRDMQAVVGNLFAIERELGGGGMSRVFLATETSLGRKVVVKVLPHELVGAISTERFRREILVTAALQHPFIVPVLAAGEVDGLPYYTMPFVAGESVRARLRDGGRLPVRDTVEILSNVAAALDHAHTHGVVHRDLKPENVLLSGGHAIVTDFGVAKAIDSATASAEGLTSVGIALGTPAYMAPEQAAADPATDNRADFYSLGVMAYELLAGRTPFAERTPQQMLAAHLTEIPKAISEVEPTLDSDLAALVMRLLEKEPSARPQHAADIIRELGSIRARVADGNPVRKGRTPRSRRVAIISATAVIAASAAVAVVLRLNAGRVAPEAEARRVAVAPFENRSGDTSLGPVAAMAAEWITNGLRESGAVDVVEPNALRGSGSSTDPISLARSVGAGIVVVGAMYRIADSVHASARIADARTGQVLRSVPDIAAPAADPMKAIDGLRRRVMGALATVVDPSINQFAGIASQPPSFEAYHEYVEGRRAHLRGDQRLALEHAYRAIALDSAFTLPFVVATFAHSNLGECAKTDSLVRRLESRHAQMPVFDRLQIDRVAASCRGDHQAAYEAARAIRRFAPKSIQAAVQVGGEAAILGRYRDAVAIFDSIPWNHPAVRENVAFFANYVIALHETQRFARELEVARLVQQRFPAEPLMVAREIAALAGLGRVNEVRARLRELESSATLADSLAGQVLLDAAAEVEAHEGRAESTSAWEAAIAWYRARQDTRAAWSLDGLASAVEGANRWPEAWQLFSQIAKRYATEPSFHGQRAVIALHLGLRAEADSESAFLVRRDDRISRYWLALIAAHAGDRDAAVAKLRDVMTSGSPDDFILFHMEEMLLPLRGYPPFEALVASKR